MAAGEVPDGFETASAAGVTVAWEQDVAIEPVTVAYVAAGIVNQVAIVTGTQPRNDVVVVVYASVESFRDKTGSPEWSDGQYDGAVRVPAVKGTDFGIAIHTLRHELMHAQIHAAIGCTPIWLNEGAAQYFANTAPDRVWLRMLKAHAGPEPKQLAVATIDEVHEDPSLAYAQSLAMVLYAFGKGDSLADVLHDQRGAWTELWARRYDAAEHDVLDAVARRVFGVAQGPELDALLAGDVCCRGMSTLSELACHGATRDKGEICRSIK